MSKELEYKLSQSKSVIMMLLVIVAVLAALVGYNYYQIGRMGEIASGNYIEIDTCQRLCDERYETYVTYGEQNNNGSMYEIYGYDIVWVEDEAT